ncbi:hypothetical protein AERO_17940 [Aeromicrobium fastidiosum]|uniref:hypothetical protein n=1 Tax=Aeromicrobium fastidiosum TaxID=52699 RepID=UPI0020235853|nr:hypothetical protein [Aeromicrobium fastidiosum]MCL8253268.1 hypothetical protein [Aeromicrobium fastidiosum]
MYKRQAKGPAGEGPAKGEGPKAPGAEGDERPTPPADGEKPQPPKAPKDGSAPTPPAPRTDAAE